MITFEIDELTPCLKDTETGELVQTEVVELKRKSFLAKFNKRTGWYVNWSQFSKSVRIFALVLKGTMDIQGLVAVSPNFEMKTMYIDWACTAPHNDKNKTGKQKYIGVGGHLIAIAAEMSMRYGFNGWVFGKAINERVFKHLIYDHGALPLPKSIHPFALYFDGVTTKRIREVYDYEWTDEII